MLYIIYGSIQPGQEFDAISVTKLVREAFWIKKWQNFGPGPNRILSLVVLNMAKYISVT